MNSILGNKKAIAILIGPALLVYTLVMLVPMVWSLGYTVTAGNPVSGFTYVGLANIKKLFTDPDVGNALLFTLKYAIVITVGQILVGYGLALLYVFALKKSSN